MGAQQSSGGNADCRPCFAFPSIFKRNANLNDPLGSPLPDTPLSRWKRRAFSSRYDGLEKEVISPDQARFYASNTNTSRPGDVHEGSDAEAALHQKYQLMEVLGVGSTSTCHRCVDKKTGFHYACKVIDKQMIKDRFHGMMEQFHTEIEALRALNHPSIIQLLDVFISEEKIFIVMELMEGGELFDYVVQKGTLTEDEASKIVRKVTSAMVYMHSKNIVHRDLKPENLLLRRKPEHPEDAVDVKIIDFGLSKCMTEPVAQSFLGTRGYLAPEMLQRRDYTKAVDTWALGVIVFVLLCGCLPFDDDSATVPSDDLVRAKFVLRFPRWAKNLSPSAKDLLSHLLDVNPTRRYTAEQALDHAWVTGKEAPKGNLLSSPGRIKKSPALRKGLNRTPQSGGRQNISGKYYLTNRQAANMALSPPPQRVMARKTSI
mmetsp:Transcript_16685/g.38519  ORF Transcript_16685/g.38519 Transcript_16685/m.38519 type:complete len:430 (+) Transcript_16685:207-1496(+)|eukprot:CAMPEP_0197174574 /NCGR_PEP_ID=MMETSP1423-20130617/1033_1 /TAXON_ID=476441 /ORGANISM="Pseudo-nitzschia heimii, Strain UNC1101" /LENGTH=429 /DNA_ID=CAMNT_0042623517 /DNA_START=172 /DNA_END=1461 /DNA_ORIENTATION=+